MSYRRVALPPSPSSSSPCAGLVRVRVRVRVRVALPPSPSPLTPAPCAGLRVHGRHCRAGRNRLRRWGCAAGAHHSRRPSPCSPHHLTRTWFAQSGRVQLSGSHLCGKQGRYGRPARPKRLIGRGWPKLGAACGTIWHWKGPPESQLAEV
eukprot:scaffold48399_cov35-Phaeocystis_antarctica.AAC.1